LENNSTNQTKESDKIMGCGTELATEFNNFVRDQGRVFRIRYFTGSSSADDYDDAQVLTQLGSDVYFSGISLTIDMARGSQESILMEQGKIKKGDLKFWMPNTVSISGIFRIGIGSPSTEEYAQIAQSKGGVQKPAPDGVIVYNKFYGRFLTTGSLAGEENS